LRHRANGRVEAHDLRRDGSDGAVCHCRRTLGDGIDVGRVDCRGSESGSRLRWGPSALSGCCQGFRDGADGCVKADDIGGDGANGAVCDGGGTLGDRVDIGRVNCGCGEDRCRLGRWKLGGRYGADSRVETDDLCGHGPDGAVCDCGGAFGDGVGGCRVDCRGGQGGCGGGG
jgi:hypothetical protein